MTSILLALIGCHASPPVPTGAGVEFQAGPPALEPPEITVLPLVHTTPSLVINELISANESQWQDPADLTTPDWIELYNAGDTAVALSEVEVKVAGGKWKGTDGEIPPGGYFFLVANDLVDDANHASFGLSALGEEIELQVGDERVDAIATGPMYDDVVWARFPDGGAWLPSIRATPGWTNGTAPPESLDPRDGVFQTDHVLRVDISLTQAAWNELDASSAFSETWVEGDIVVEGIQYPGSGVRLKGSGSFDDMDGKPNFKLDLNTADTGLRFRGLRAITLNSGNIYDPSRTHEFQAYTFARAIGLAAPRVGWVHAYVNGEDYGVYQNVETWDEEFVDRWWPGQVNGQLFEGSGCDFGDGYDATACKYDEGPEVADLSGVIYLDSLVEDGAFGPAKDELWTILNHDKWLTYMAWEGITDHWDGYHSPNNWRFYQDGFTGLFEWLPSGTDWTWDGPPSVYEGNGNVIELCLDMNDCKRDYEDFVVSAANVADTLGLPYIEDDLRIWLHDEIFNDPRSDHSANDISSTFESTIQYLAENPEDARQDVQ